MQIFFSLLFFMLLTYLIIGLVAPSVLVIVKTNPNRKDILKWIGIPTLLTLIIIMIIAPQIDYYKEGDKEFAKGEYGDAYEYYLKVSKSDKNYFKALDKASKIKFVMDSLSLVETKKEELKKQQYLAEQKAKNETEKVNKEQEELYKEKQLTIIPSSESENRKDKIDSQFSSWDGSHLKLEKYIKDNMNDPDSYEHVETSYKDMNDYILIYTKYRGNNSFGGKVLGSTKAKVDLDGNILEIIE